jgi:hypothetical protein
VKAGLARPAGHWPDDPEHGVTVRAALATVAAARPGNDAVPEFPAGGAFKFKLLVTSRLGRWARKSAASDSEKKNAILLATCPRSESGAPRLGLALTRNHDGCAAGPGRRAGPPGRAVAGGDDP